MRYYLIWLGFFWRATLVVGQLYAFEERALQGAIGAQLDAQNLAATVSTPESDSTALATNAERSPQLMIFPDPDRPNLFLDSLRKLLIVEHGDFLRWVDFTNSLRGAQEEGAIKASRPLWVVLVAGLLILLFGLVRLFFPQDVKLIVQAYFSDRLLAQVNKEDTLYSSWPFIFLYIIFGFTVGLFLYHSNTYYKLSTYLGGAEAFLGFSLLVMLLFALKIVVNRILGVVFELQRLSRDYISILYLSYFNVAIMLIPAVFAICFLPPEDISWMIPMVLILIFLLLLYRLIKTANNLMETYRFSKFYLIVYICTLEIAPVLILIQVLRNN